jgi:hypothetical protein
MMQSTTGILFRELMTQGAGLRPGGFELLSPLPLHSAAQFTWRIRIPGRGAYMGTADEYTDENGKKQVHCANPDRFVPEE